MSATTMMLEFPIEAALTGQELFEDYSSNTGRFVRANALASYVRGQSMTSGATTTTDGTTTATATLLTLPLATCAGSFTGQLIAQVASGASQGAVSIWSFGAACKRALPGSATTFTAITPAVALFGMPDTALSALAAPTLTIINDAPTLSFTGLAGTSITWTYSASYAATFLTAAQNSVFPQAGAGSAVVTVAALTQALLSLPTSLPAQPHVVWLNGNVVAVS